MPLSGSVVLVTGATGSIGRPLTEALLTAHARLAIGVRRIEDVHPVDSALRQRGLSAFISPCDVRYEEDVVRLVHRVIRQFGRIDMLINAAMIDGLDERIVDYPVDPWRKVIATNLTGSYLLCREVLPWMTRQRRGCIALVQRAASSDSRPTPGVALVTWQAVEALLQQLAGELNSTQVRLHALQIPPSGPSEPTGPAWVDAILKLAHDQAVRAPEPVN